MSDTVPLTTQLARARRALALRERVYPRVVARENMRPQVAQRLLAAEAARDGQGDLFGREAELMPPEREREP